MITVAYSFYTDTYKGELVSSSDFSAVENKATLILDTIAPANIMILKESDLSLTDIMKYKMCICNLCDAIMQLFTDGVSQGIITQEKVGAWTTTYSVKEGTDAYSTLYNIVNMWLSGTQLMCMWV